jgi:DNA-directed RNA polymerase subunit RPC12/RpoP
MAKRIGRCSACGQAFKRSRITGRLEGCRIVSDERHGKMVQCQRCGRKATIDGLPA